MGIQFNGNTDTISTNDGTLNVTPQTTFGGEVGIAGTLTYEDVTNVDSVGVITARTDINLGDSIIHIGDTNTKIRFPAADTISFETTGSERLRIDSSGRLQQGSDTSNLGASKFNIVTGGEDGISLGRNQTSTVSSGDVLGTLAFQSAIGSQTTNTAEASIKGIAAENSTGSTAATDLAFFTKSTGTGPGSAPIERLRIKSDGKTGIGTDDPQTIFHILDNVPTIRFTDKNSTGTPDCEVGGAGGNVDISADINGEKSNSVIRFNVDGEQKVAVDSNGALLLSTAGTRRNTKGSSQYQAFLVEGTTNNTTRMSMIRSSNDDNGPEIQIIKTRGTSVGSVTKPNQNDYLGAFVFLAGDDSDLFTRGAEIGVQATGTPANDRCPTDIIFSTTPTSGASTPQESMRITKDGYITKPRQAMFEAGGNNTAFSAQSPLPYPTIKYNIGSCYNNLSIFIKC